MPFWAGPMEPFTHTKVNAGNTMFLDTLRLYTLFQFYTEKRLYNFLLNYFHSEISSKFVRIITEKWLVTLN